MRDRKRLNEYEGKYYDTYEDKLPNNVSYEVVEVPVKELIEGDEYVIETGAIIRYFENGYIPVRMPALRSTFNYSELTARQLRLFWTLVINKWENVHNAI